MNDENNSLIEWLREDIIGMRTAFEGMGREFERLAGGVVNLNNRIEHHEKNCPAILAMMSPGKNKGLPWWLFKLGPFILAAALGLLGLGAYLGSGQSIEKLENQVGTIQKVMKIQDSGE